VAPVAAAVALNSGPVALAGAFAARAASSTDRPAAGASTPAAGACSTTALGALGDGGGGFHLSGARPLSLSSSSSSDDDEFSGVAGGGALAAHAADTFHSPAPSTPGAGFSSPSLASPAPVKDRYDEPERGE
jgi:hypothetical protein